VSTQLRLEDGSVADYLRGVGIAPQSEPLRVEAVGDGNINWVRRVRGAAGSWVVKQARPSLERFPQYRVSTERIVFEARYYEEVARFDAWRVCPAVLHFDPKERVLVLEDLGDAERLDARLARGEAARDAAAALAAFLGAVHRGTRGADLAARFCNDEMRRLHGDHIFELPFRENDFPLSPALRQRADEIRADRTLVASFDAAYASYLAPGRVLVHGDVQPANVLLTAAGPKLLDAEIAHVGDPAFDVGQLLGHLLLPALARGEPERAAPSLAAAWRAYAEAHGSEGLARPGEAARYAGIELLRRSLGAARVPAVASDAAGHAVVDAGVRLVRGQLALV
jgi:5-methylthioribose kinase